ncbi:MAG TPA: glycosyl hydrolase family 28-related protein [Tepidisphaeraceae bacterium]|nr:glycosyl hydrolase family 28-related protein [Tepidisphaeraceae bacterium]
MTESGSPKQFDVLAYGASGTGTRRDTAAIQAAVDACAAAGGGTVVLPCGRYLSGTILLRDNIDFHLMHGAVLVCSSDLADFPSPHLLHAHEASNVTIRGGGEIDGRGREWCRQLETPPPWACVPHHAYEPIEGRPLPLVHLIACQRVRIEDVMIRKLARLDRRPPGVRWRLDTRHSRR